MERINSDILRWRRGLLGLCAFALIMVGVYVWMVVSVEGRAAIVEVPTDPLLILVRAAGTPFVDRAVPHLHGPAHRAGLRTGDLIDLRQLSAVDRYVWTFNHFRSGERIAVPVVRGSRIVRISVVPERVHNNWDEWLFVVGSIWALLFAALIAWRRAESVEARVLVVLLNAWVFATILLPYSWVTPWTVADAVVGVVGAVTGYLGFALLAAYAMLFARPPSLARRGLAWLSYGTAVLASLYGIVATIGVWTLTADPAQNWYTGSIAQTITGILPPLFPLLCALVTLAQTRGVERTRLAWASVSLGLIFLTEIAWGVIDAFEIGSSFGIGAGPSLKIITVLSNVAVFLTPVGLAYALVSRRLLDIGFVINQTAVFSGVSVIVVGLFMLGESVLGGWFSRVSHLTNVEIGAALALTLGFSVRAIHARVERVLDWMFFRKRHHDETAILRFAEEASGATDAATLVRGTKETLETHADAAFVTLAMDDGAGRYGGVGEDDPAIVALHDRHKAVDLKTLLTQLQGEFAYPMIARGKLVGALVLGPKRSGESYAPDESHAIMQLAHEVGSALRFLTLEKVLQEHHLPA